MIVWHYLNEQYGLEALQKQSIKVARLRKLNDPADCQPRLIGAPDQGTPEKNEAFTSNYLAEIDQGWGVMCYSGVLNDPVIWSHYADSHQGIAIGLNYHESGEPLYEVTYLPDRPEINYEKAQATRLDGKITAAFVKMAMTDGFSRKAPSWKYEREYRRLVPLNANRCEMIGPHYFERLGVLPECVILGVRCRLHESDVKRAAMRRGQPYEIRVYRASQNPATFTIDVDPEALSAKGPFVIPG
jgi:Protein of unknown function (DUF2971)